MSYSGTTKIEKLLKYFSHKILAKYQPFVIGITGSVGKTSSRHAIAAALGAKYKLREPEKNFNNTIGIPLTIIGARGLDETTGFVSQKLGWLRIFVKAMMVWLLPQDYPKMLVLEYGIDHPRDMDSLIDIVKPDLAVLTLIGTSHLENFSSQDELAFEKGKLPASVSAEGTVVFNKDNGLSLEQMERVVARKVSFGNDINNHPDVLLTSFEEELGITPVTNLKIKTPTRELSINIPVLGMVHQQAVLTAVAVAEALEVETDLILKGLKDYRSVPGRLNVIPGIKKSILIDDSYNAAPVSTIEALHLLGRFPNPIKMAALGDMLELGESSDDGHAEVGKLAASLGLNKLVAVGQLGKKIAEAAKLAGMTEEKIVWFENSAIASQEILKILEPETVILVKGSQGARMEKISKELLAEPTGAAHFLPRQYGKWLTS